MALREGLLTVLSDLVKGKLKGPGSAAVLAASQDRPKLLCCPF